jgi:hypothetical protein
MATDLKINQGENQDHIALEANSIEARAADFELDSPGRRSQGAVGPRRALVHDQRDGLTINYNGDYPAGVSVVAANINLRPTTQGAGDPKLPATGRVGDLLLIRNANAFQGQVLSDSLTLWLCIGAESGRARPGGVTNWKQVQLGDSVEGTE